MSCGLVVKPLGPSAFQAFLGLKSPKTRRSFLSAPRRLSIFWVTFWVRISRGGTSKNCAAVKNVAGSRASGPRARRPHVAACEGLCEALAERAAPGTLRRLRAVCGLCGRRLTRRFLQGYLQRENNMGNGTRAAVLWVKSGGFGQPKKVLDKGRWSLATTSRPQSPAVRGFPGLWYRRRFSRFRSFGAVVELQGTTVPSGSGVFHRRREMGAFFR